MTAVSLPFARGETYPIRDLRAFAAELAAQRQADFRLMPEGHATVKSVVTLISFVTFGDVSKVAAVADGSNLPIAIAKASVPARANDVIVRLNARGDMARLRPAGLRRGGAAAFARCASEGWWARQDSNLRQHRYKRRWRLLLSPP
jgi:hypothetical protein